MNFVLRFLLNLSITPLPAEELNELCAAFLTWLFVTCSPALSKKIYLEFYIKSGVLCLLSFPEDRC